MANEEHVALLKQGMDAWNAWRDKNPDILLDLSHADLNEAKLNGTYLCGAAAFHRFIRTIHLLFSAATRYRHDMVEVLPDKQLILY